jgi:hypothetical protein
VTLFLTIAMAVLVALHSGEIIRLLRAIVLLLVLAALLG